MKRAYIAALGTGGVGMAAIVWSISAGPDAPPVLLLIAAAFAPLAVLLAAWGRLGGRFPAVAMLTGGLLAPILAIIGETLVFGFMAAFVAGFADSGRRLIESLHADPQLTTALASPWVLVLLVNIAVTGPLIEELTKAAGGIIARPASRREAFLFGVAAGCAFAITEDLLYAGAAVAYGGPWPLIAMARAMGAAVHPLACGLVMLGWWEWRTTKRPGALVRGYLSGAGVHAFWNASLVVVGVVESAMSAGGTLSDSLQPVSLVYMAALGVLAVALLTVAVLGVSAGRDGWRGLRLRDSRALASWTVMSASLLIPVAVLVLAFPSFYRG